MSGNKSFTLKFAEELLSPARAKREKVQATGVLMGKFQHLYIVNENVLLFP